uniref:Tc1-like transposase DDE domain-containing protein n=1 Tax=Lepeophtheirus salmonis TaxID=72036 RepID=A0A0K2V028_LEPSM
MVFGIVSSESHVMPPQIFETDLRVNTDIYLQVLEDIVWPWIKSVVSDRPWMWQEDSGPAHKAKWTQEWLKSNAFSFVPFSSWPPLPLDLNPLDYFVWSYVENMTNLSSILQNSLSSPALRRNSVR